jgi:hypothetical protein
MTREKFTPFAARHLDPSARMAELLFGLIMTLTFTLGASLVVEEEGREGARNMLLAIFGCNLAWGVIDGVLYLLGQLFERGRLRRIGLQLREAGTVANARDIVAAELDAQLEPISEAATRLRLYEHIAEYLRGLPLRPNRITRADLLGALASGWVVFACSFPAALPFALLSDPRIALRVSNAILLGLLFFVGYRAARFTLARPWIVGAVFLLVGAFLVAMTIALGG